MYIHLQIRSLLVGSSVNREHLVCSWGHLCESLLKIADKLRPFEKIKVCHVIWALHCLSSFIMTGIAQFSATGRKAVAPTRQNSIGYYSLQNNPLLRFHSCFRVCVTEQKQGICARPILAQIIVIPEHTHSLAACFPFHMLA